MEHHVGDKKVFLKNNKVINTLSDFVNNRTEDADAFLEVTFPLNWIKENQNFLDIIPKTSETILSTTIKKQFEINEAGFLRIGLESAIYFKKLVYLL